MMKYSTKLLLVVLTITVFACKSETTGKKTNEELKAEKNNAEENKTEVKTDEKIVQSEKPTIEPIKMCFYGEGNMANSSVNLLITGDKVQGMMYFEIPKAGSTIYSISNIEGAKEGNKFMLTMTEADNDRGEGIGKTSKAVYYLENDQLISEEEKNNPDGDVDGILKKTTCSDGVKFSAEIKKVDLSPVEYKLKGQITGGKSFTMNLTGTPNPDEPKEISYTGEYAFTDTPDEKVKISGVMPSMGMMPMFLEDDKGRGDIFKFVIELGSDFSNKVYGLWLDAEANEVEVVIEPVQ